MSGAYLFLNYRLAPRGSFFQRLFHQKSLDELQARRESVVEQLKRIKDVRDVGQVYGQYDLVVHIESETIEQLKLIGGKIYQIDDAFIELVLTCGDENEWRRFYGHKIMTDST